MENEATTASSLENVYETNEHQNKSDEKGSDSKDFENNILKDSGDREGNLEKCENGNMIPVTVFVDSTDKSDSSNAKVSDGSSAQQLKVKSAQNVSNESEDIELKWEDDLDDENDQTPGLLDDLELINPAKVVPDEVPHTSEHKFKSKNVVDEGHAMDIDSTGVESVLDKVIKSPEVSKNAHEKVTSLELLSDHKNKDEITNPNSDVENKSTHFTEMEVDISEDTDNNDSNRNIDLDETTKEVETFLLELENNDLKRKDHQIQASCVTVVEDKQSNNHDYKNIDASDNSMETKSSFETATVDKNKELISVEFTVEREQPKSSSYFDNSKSESITEPKLDVPYKSSELSVDVNTSSDINMAEDLKMQEVTLELPAEKCEGDDLIVTSDEISKIDQDIVSDAELTEFPSKSLLAKKDDLDMDIENFISSSVPIEATDKCELTETSDLTVSSKEVSQIDQEIATASDAESTKLHSKTSLQKKVDSDMDIENFISSSGPIKATNDMIVAPEEISKLDQDIKTDADSTKLPSNTSLTKKVDHDMDIENFISSSVPIEATDKSDTKESNDMIVSSEEISKIDREISTVAESMELATKTLLEKKVDLHQDIENFNASSVPIEATVMSETKETNDVIVSSEETSKIDQEITTNAKSTELLTKTTSEKKVDLDQDIENFIASSVPIEEPVISETKETNDMIIPSEEISKSDQEITTDAESTELPTKAILEKEVDLDQDIENFIASSVPIEATVISELIETNRATAHSSNTKVTLSSSTDLVQSTIKNIIPSSSKHLEAIEVPTLLCSIEDDQAIEDPIPTSSKEVDQVIEDPIPLSNKEFDESTKESTPSTSKERSTDEPASNIDLDVEQMAPDASDEIPEVADSLGLLAESKVRVLDEEEDQEDDDDGDDEEDGDDDQDDESNVPTAEHSEDSNQQTSETETPKDTADQSESSFSGKLLEKETAIDEEVGETDLADVGGDKDDARMDVDETSEDKTSEPPGPEVLPTIAAITSMEIETVKLSDTSDSEINSEAEGKQEKSILKEILVKPVVSAKKSPVKEKPESPSKKKLEICQTKEVLNIVELEESSSEDDIQVVNKDAETAPADQPGDATGNDTESQVTTVNIPKEVDIISAATGTTLELEDKEGETVIKGVPKPVTTKKAKLNTSEISIKTATASESTLVIPETKVADIVEKKVSKPKFGLEVFNLDSDDENSTEAKLKEKPVTPPKPPSPRLISRCVNPMCTSDASVDRISASAAILRFYDVSRRRKAKVCRPCADCVAERSFGLVEGVTSMRPLLEIEMSRPSQQLVEISDSDSDGEPEDATARDADKIGVEGATLLEEQLADIINSTWRKYNLDDRLKVAKDEIDFELEKLEKERLEIDAMLNTCQAATDKLRLELYATFGTNTRTVPALDIMDTPFAQYSTAVSETESNTEETEVRRSKRKTALGQTQKKESVETIIQPGDTKDDDNTDIKVVKLSAEVAPVDLPPSGTLVRPPLLTGQSVYAMRHAFGSWLKGLVQDIYPKGATPISSQFTVCKVRFEHKVKNPVAQISARHMAYPDPANVRLTIGTRVIALFSDITDATKRRSYYSGVIAEMPNPVNSYRYLVFFDDGYAQYVTHAEIRVVCECSSLVWEEVHPFSREFVRQYLVSYPERPMVRLHAGQSLKTEWNGKWWVSKVIKVDASLVQIHFEADDRTEWIYRGSTRLAPLYLELQNAERPRARPLPRSTQHRINTPYVEYTRSDEQEAKAVQAQKENEDFKKQRAVAKKSTALPTTTEHRPPPSHQQPLDNVMSRVVYYTPKAAVKPHKMRAHTCSPNCKRTDVLPLKELRTYNPLARPLLSGWERQILRFKGRKEVMYRAPCGRRLRDLPELHRYLRATNSEMGVDLFDFAVNTHCLAEFVLNRCLVSKKDLSHGKENVPVPCVNYYDNSLPEFCSYNTERTPTAGVPLNLDPDFLCGCDCTDDCQDKSKCACWKMTLDGARTIGMDIDDIGYVYKRLLDPVPSGIYECNSRCKCKQTCLNRVAQHPLQLKLQVFKTLNRGWGIRALNDVPRGSFLCVYAGNLLTDATANLDGLNEGDEYLAELDYIEVVEQMKEGYEGDIPDKDKELDKIKKESDDEEEEESSTSEDERREKERERQDNDFRPAYDIPAGCLEFNKRLRKRDKKKKDKNKGSESQSGEKKGDDCITISDDDEEVREPQRFAAQAGMGANDFISKHKSVRTLYGKDEACYIMDAKVQGNIGRYLNHSCTPNVFVQNVFVDTHDPRFPWVAFFALSHIRAGTELTWNYNYDVGSVPGKILYCYCGASNCRGRLL